MVAAGEATRFGGGGHEDHSPPEKPGTGGFGKYSRTHHLLRSGDSTLVSDPSLP
jgi:hypothetical protein